MRPRADRADRAQGDRPIRIGSHPEEPTLRRTARKSMEVLPTDDDGVASLATDGARGVSPRGDLGFSVRSHPRRGKNPVRPGHYAGLADDADRPPPGRRLPDGASA